MAVVKEWLRGGTPHVYAEPRAPRPERRVIPFSFRSPDGNETVAIDDPVELAAAMGVHWDDALACFSDAREHLRVRRALRDFLRTAGQTDADQILMSTDGDEEDRLLRFRLALDPDADPYFRVELGRRLSEAFPRATFTTVPAGRTFLPLDRPDKVADEITAATARP